ncbi:MAG: 50S ribosomal protein L19 [Halanaerobiales bacterium]
MNIIDSIEKGQLRDDIPEFMPGDTVELKIKVQEGGKERLQPFTGVVLKRQGGGARETFTIRKVSHGVGVERTFPIHSPRIESLKVKKRGDVRRARLYYLRERKGKASRIKEKRD